MPYVNCQVCQQKFRYSPSQQKGECCSVKCREYLKNIRLMESGRASKEAAITYLRYNAQYKCSKCNISEWQGQFLRLQIEHKDGNPKNNTIDNVCWLCPNCHTQTPTWGFKNASDDAKARSREGSRRGGIAVSIKNRGL